MLHRLKHRLHRSQHPERFGYLQQLLQNQSLDREQLLIKQQRELNEIIAFAVEHTDFYRDKYRSHLSREGRDARIERLPILRKDEVVAQLDAMVARELDKDQLSLGHTGGSTGKPLTFYYDRDKIELMRAGMCRSYMWSGWQPGEKILNFWGARQDLKKTHGMAGRYNEFIAAEITIGAYEYTESDLHTWAETIRSYRPVLLQGYASILAELAGYIIAQKIPMPGSLKGVYSTAEVLYEHQRETMERAFSCRVYNQYGSREIPNIGLECSQGNLHVFTDMVYLESISQGDTDKLIITSLTNRVMPLIRYEIGDSGRLKPGDCPCGSPFPMLEMEFCRSNDIITTPNGNHVYPAYFNRLLDGVSGIQQYQFTQIEWHKIRLNIQTSTAIQPELESALQRKLQQELDPQLHLEIVRVAKIARTRSGKHRFVINNTQGERQ